MKRLLSLVLTLCTSTYILNAQGPWVPKKGSGFAQISYSGLFYSQSRVGDETVETGQKNRDFTYQLYANYGVTNKLEATVILPLKNTFYTRDGSRQSLTGLGNVEFGLKYLLLDKNSKISVGVHSSFRTGTSNNEVGLRTGYEAHTTLPYITIGSGTKKMYFYANAGYGIRTNGYSNFTRFAGEMGYRLTSKIILAGTIDFTQFVNDESEFYQNEGELFFLTSNYLDRQLFNGAGLKAIIELKPEKYGFIVSSIGALGAENIPFSRSYNFGAYVKF